MAHIASTTPREALQAGPMVRKAGVGTELTILSVLGFLVEVARKPVVVILAPIVMAVTLGKERLAAITTELAGVVAILEVVGPTGRQVVVVPATLLKGL